VSGWAAGCASSSREGRPCPGRSRVPARHRRSHPRGVRAHGDLHVTTVNRLERYKFGTVGKALPGTEIRIAADGEILVRGPHIFREYFNDPAATRESIEPDGWFHTGDIGVLDEEGFLRITDRKKDIIVTSGGKNIAPQNLENLLKNDRYVSQAFVYGDRKKFLTALLTLAPEEIVPWAARQGIQDRSVEALAKHPRCCN